jgi:hypothetical protein
MAPVGLNMPHGINCGSPLVSTKVPSTSDPIKRHPPPSTHLGTPSPDTSPFHCRPVAGPPDDGQ